MKIVSVTEDGIIFEDGSAITCYHHQDFYECNYADFEQIDDAGRNHDYVFPLRFESIEGAGFRFGDNNLMTFIPCYSAQNGYYTGNIQIYFGKKKKKQKVLSFDAELKKCY